MKLYPLLSALLLSGMAALSQPMQGKITYQMGFVDPPQDYKRITMWFSSSNYLYRYAQNVRKPGATPTAKRYTNIQDSIRDAKIEAQLKAAQDEANANQVWYGELGSNVVTNSTFDQNRKTYCIRDTISFVDWQLAGDTMTIRNILCQKATGKYREMNYVAWFAPSIPASVAPLQFRGLPGLLIKEINLTAGTGMVMTELEWPLKESVVIQPCHDAPFISRKEFTALMDDQNEKTRQMIEELKKNGNVKETTINHQLP